jgi:hypothetical protein
MTRPYAGKRLRFASALCGGSSIAEAARLADIAEKTGRRWVREAEVRAEVAACQERLRAELYGSVLQAAQIAAAGARAAMTVMTAKVVQEQGFDEAATLAGRVLPFVARFATPPPVDVEVPPAAADLDAPATPEVVAAMAAYLEGAAGE